MKIINNTLHNLYNKTLIIDEYNGYKYIQLGTTRGKYYRLWINNIDEKKAKRVVYYPNGNYHLTYWKPIIKDTSIKIGKKPQNLIAIEYPDHHILIVKIPAGYRGGAKLISIEPEPIKMLEYSYWSSPRGNLGKGVGLLIETNADYMQVKGKYFGRTNGEITFDFNIKDEILKLTSVPL